MYVNALKVLKKLSYSTWSRSGKTLQLPHSSIFQNSLKFCFLYHFSTLEQVRFPGDNGICKLPYDTCLKEAHIDPKFCDNSTWKTHTVVSLENPPCWYIVRIRASLCWQPYSWGNGLTHGLKTSPIRQVIANGLCPMLIRAQKVCFCLVSIRNNRRWLLQHTLSSRTKIQYPKKLLLHCRAFPKNHKTEQGAKNTLAWSTNPFSITLFQLPHPTNLYSLCPSAQGRDKWQLSL